MIIYVILFHFFNIIIIFSQIDTLKTINTKIKSCRMKYMYVEEMTKKNKIMDDFKDILDKLMNLKEELRKKMRNFVENL